MLPSILEDTGQLHSKELSSPKVSHAEAAHPRRKREEVWVTEGGSAGRKRIDQKRGQERGLCLEGMAWTLLQPLPCESTQVPQLL